MSDEQRIGVALAALAEVTDPGTVGALVDATVPVPGVIDLRFAAVLPGYDGWSWTVSTSAVDGVEPTVLELELLPGEGALVAPAWVPWEERLAEWRRAHPDEADDADDGSDDLEDDEDDEESEVDESDLDDDPIDDVLDDAALTEAEPDDEAPRG